jgi:DNA-binding transcriptional MerR regulator/methylmalonyl-CoA mutase cobalamin-binding subunit
MPLPIPIASVERETGIGKDTLRVWERRYGFPQPHRDANGERLYPPEQVEHLRLIKRLMDQGHRPGRLFSLSAEERLELAESSPSNPVDLTRAAPPLIAQALARLKSHDSQGLAQALKQALARQGLRRFVLETVAPLNRAVGDAWTRGELEVFAEHLYTELMTSLLRQAISSQPSRASKPPHILLTTVPEEQHGLGLLMAESLLSLDGATCISLGTQTPLFDIQRAAEAHQANIVALSFSAAFPLRKIAPLLKQLRDMLPPDIGLWAGGATTERLATIDGVVPLARLEDALAALQRWRSDPPA